MSNYFIYNPGNTYIYKSTNYNSGGVGAVYTGLTRLQIERETSLCYGTSNSITVRPWRFTKENDYDYWNPKIYNLQQNDNLDLRWMIVSPYYTAAGYNFGNYYWGIGDKRYTNSYPRAWYDISPRDFVVFNNYQINSGSMPPYFVGLKSIAMPSIFYSKAVIGTQGGATLCPTIFKAGSATGNWKIRMEKLNNLVINNGSFNYSGEGVRVDYFEGSATNFMSNGLLRESWYFAKDIGLVRVKVAHFNNYGNMGTLAPPYSQSSDCLGDEIENPDVDVVLKNYYLNPTFYVQVSADGSNWNTSINITKSSDGNYYYYLKTTNQVRQGLASDSNFTGYLEAKNPNGKVFKWLWIQNGVIKVNLGSSWPANNTSCGFFRLWVPNDAFPNETILSDPGIPWSNEICVTTK